MIAVSHPDDALYASRMIAEDVRLVTSTRCPRQTLIFLASNLIMMVESGSWFDAAPEATRLRAKEEIQRHFETLLESGYRRCQATKVPLKSGIQCRNSVRVQGVAYCTGHDKEREFEILRVGSGLDKTSENPLTGSDVDKIRITANEIQYSLAVLRRLAIDTPSGYLDQVIEMLAKCGERLTDVLDTDRKQDAATRMGLRIRINQMIGKIEQKYGREAQEIHSEWMREGGPSQSSSSIEELKQKIDWLYLAYSDAFEADTREWLSPELNGMEPGKIKKVQRS